MADTYMIIHIEIPYNYNETQDISDNLVRNIFISEKLTNPTKYSNCKEFQIIQKELSESTSSKFDIITITEPSITAISSISTTS